MMAVSVRSDETASLPNGSGAAAILAAGVGCALIGILALAGDASEAIGKLLNFYNPTGTLSGVTSVSIVVWLMFWYVLHRQWRTKTVAMIKVNVAAFIGLAIEMDGDLKLALLADPIAEMEAAIASRNGSMSTQSTRLLAARLSPWRGS